MDYISKFILSMAILRFISGTIEISAGLLILRLNDIEKALIVNSLLALVGPIILVSSISIGLVGIADKISFSKIFLIFLGVFLIVIGLKK